MAQAVSDPKAETRRLPSKASGLDPVAQAVPDPEAETRRLLPVASGMDPQLCKARITRACCFFPARLQVHRWPLERPGDEVLCLVTVLNS